MDKGEEEIKEGHESLTEEIAKVEEIEEFLEETKDYSSVTKKEIKAKLDEKGVNYPSNSNKEELIKLLEENDNKIEGTEEV